MFNINNRSKCVNVIFNIALIHFFFVPLMQFPRVFFVKFMYLYQLCLLLFMSGKHWANQVSTFCHFYAFFSIYLFLPVMLKGSNFIVLMETEKFLKSINNN